MKEIVTFYVLLGLKDLEFLAENNFISLPSNELPFTLKKEDIEKYAETSMKYTEDTLITARVECDMNLFTAYRDSHPDDDSSEFGGLSEVKTNTLNHALIDKIKIENIFGKDLQNIENERTIALLDGEQRFFEWRLRIFLDKNTREIIPYNYFKREKDELSSEENIEKIKAEIDEETKYLKKKTEKTFKINSVEEAVNYLIHEDLDEEDIKSFKNKSCAARLEHFGENFGFHFGYGMYLRNLFFHGNKNQQFLDDLEKYKPNIFLDSGEFGEGIIYDLLWRKLNSCETSQENAKKVRDIQAQIENSIKDDSDWNLYITMKLLSYNFTEDEIKKQLELEKRMDDDNGNFEEYYFQQKALLARLNKEDRETFENIKQDYFKIQNVVKKLKLKS
ncbi:hypothetical protein [Chryseobacterium sp. SIMBA_029]|uniref:hypothetical protein n=1 Tax=Chryseobacterium sp. SIMBA_029 TaxID=3085772 RepID=UPI00397A0E0C